MVLYQLRIVVAEKKFDEFFDSLLSLSSGTRKEVSGGIKEVSIQGKR